MYNITESAEELKRINSWRTMPYPVEDNGYIKIIVHSIKKFYVDVNHPSEYDRTLFITDENNNLFYNYAFDIVQEEYIFILGRLGFLNMVYSDLAGDGAVSYTTDALSVTGAKEGYKSIQQEIDALEQERIRVFHKMMARDSNET